MTECQVLETSPGAEIIGPGINAQDETFMPDPVHALAVQARFVGSYHSREERDLIEIVADFLGTFVDIEEETDSVAGPVAVVSVVLPERTPRSIVYLASGSTGRED